MTVARPVARSSSHRDTAHTVVPAAYRPDVDGLRAVAVVLVVAYHVGFRPLGGGFVGVDVFYVLSGFLITGLLGRELASTGTISFRRFYARRARRLLPMASLVLVAVAAASWLLLPPLALEQVAKDVLAAALFVVNAAFARQATDYWASDIDRSPVLHYWSLSVEEQYYVLWPILLFAVVVLGRRWWRRPFPLVGALVVVFAASLTLSVALTPRFPSSSYFGLHTRAWELAAGGLVALLARRLAWVRGRPAAALSIVGLAMVMVAAVAFDARTPFPGAAALLPVLGTVLVVVAGTNGSWGLSPVLARPGFVYVGKLSYAWYLWHWPVVVFVLLPRLPAQATPTGLFVGSAWWAGVVVVASFALSAVSHVTVENPVRFAKPLVASPNRALQMAAGLIAVTTVTAGCLSVASTTSTPTLTASGIHLTMSPRDALQDKPTTFGCGGSDAEAEEDCLFGDPDSEVRIALIGDSHAQHWFPAFRKAATVRGWSLYFWGKVGCPFMDTPLVEARSREPLTDCAQWQDSVAERVAQDGPFDLVVLSHASHYEHTMVDAAGDPVAPEDAEQTWAEATRRTLDLLEPYTDHVVLMRDTPASEVPVAECLSDALPDDGRCALDATTRTHLDAVLHRGEVAAVAGDPLVSFYDPTNLICGSEVCPVVTRSGLIVFRDDDHLTQTFATSQWRAIARLVAPWVRPGEP